MFPWVRHDLGETQAEDAGSATKSNLWGAAYPDSLRRQEEQLLSYANKTEMQVGLALSGGGMRSATFAFGFVQALAQKNLLEKVDILSTVSGGGYIGGMLSRLFAREAVDDVEDVKRAILPEGRSDADDQGRGRNGSIASGSVLRWLRENGHHLAPSGGGDLLVGGAVILRNWASVHLLLFTLFVAGFALLQAIRDGVYWLAYTYELWGLQAVNEHWPFVPNTVIWSPWFGLAEALAVVAAIVGLAYWARRKKKRSSLLENALRDHDSGHRWSVWLKYALMWFAVVAGVALVDAMGQTAYVLLHDGWGQFVSVITGGVLAAVAAFLQGGRKLMVTIRGEGAALPRLPLAVTAGVVASLLFVAWLTAANTLSHAIAWGFDTPALLPVNTETTTACGPTYLNEPKAACVVADGERSPVWSAVVFLVLGSVSLFLGQCFGFLNGSTLQPLYRARVVRAYLGASNPKRIGSPLGAKVTKVINGDDGLVAWEAVRDGRERCPYRKFQNGAPIHLVNVTVNETVQGKTNLQRNDGRGVGMAVGPAGLSAGIRHHVVFEVNGESQTARVYPEQNGHPVFRMFDYDLLEGDSGHYKYEGEALTLGQWIGISGAAFSTGIGWRTSLGLSLLTGLANVRLGHWWNSGVPRCRRVRMRDGRRVGDRSPLRTAFWAALPVQSYLIEELFARFHGVGRERWNLSDGGHFENLGAYELIRRRLPLIVIIDAEADPSYEFEGLGQLVRKARADFDAEIRFWSLKQVIDRRTGGDGAWDYVGTLDMLRRGAWRSPVRIGPDQAGMGGTPTFDEADRADHSHAHAAVATVRYEDAKTPQSVIVYVKPTLLGDEPADIRHYHASHHDFPQQTTADQFFDEAQWESYRALGELIGERVLRGDDPFKALARAGDCSAPASGEPGGSREDHAA